MDVIFTLQKQAYSNIQKILPQKKKEIFDKNSDIFLISPQNIDYWYSLEPASASTHNICF